VVHSAKNGIEIHCAIEEAPRDVAHKGSQERINGHQMPAHRIEDVREIFVALEAEFSERE